MRREKYQHEREIKIAFIFWFGRYSYFLKTILIFSSTWDDIWSIKMIMRSLIRFFRGSSWTFRRAICLDWMWTLTFLRQRPIFFSCYVWYLPFKFLGMLLIGANPRNVSHGSLFWTLRGREYLLNGFNCLFEEDDELLCSIWY